ncbi:anti-sigma factor [Sinomonas halotolerans]|uniref:Regulator of SigK n=1 Tax=Sinomonas halotolerans TaxID=1644133 RepID=A0ABU9X4C4_9MICC
MDDQLHLLTGAYALNALDDDERRRFEGSLGYGDATAEEARELAETAALLAAATTPVAPPPDLKARLMAQIAVTPQFDSAAVPATPAPTPTPDAGSRPSDAGSPPSNAGSRPSDAGSPPKDAGPLPAPPAEPTPEATVTPIGESRRRAPGSGWAGPGRWLAAAAAVLLVAAGGAGIWGARVQQERDEALRALAAATTAPSAVMGQILAAPDAKVQEATGPTGGTLLIAHSRQHSLAGVMTIGMPAPETGKVYELWLIDAAGTAKPAGLVEGKGTTWNELQGGVGQAAYVGVTVEPAGGSPQPTSDPIMLEPLSS